MSVIYDKIAAGYDASRRADPRIIQNLRVLLDVQKDKVYLDVACGTGNYTSEISKFGGTWHAFDRSEQMLSEAKFKSGLVNWHQLDVDNIGFDKGFFDGAICTLAIHHFTDLPSAVSEISRVLKPDGKLVLFTSTPQQMRTYWLCHYFPEMMDKSCKQMPSLESVEAAMSQGGLSVLSTKLFFITSEHQDLILYSGKQRPEMYLSSEIRAGISSFCNLCSDTELKDGLNKLQRDIESDEIENVIKRYESRIGDYLFIVAANS
ncbi:MAG: class I SAM-dependent methyltransferase [Candidatus Aegiribacteria sp.]|nr:class I SAM-dependent methyltransferase [Candidatus Aegiribacteria sp.]